MEMQWEGIQSMLCQLGASCLMVCMAGNGGETEKVGGADWWEWKRKQGEGIKEVAGQ